MENATPPIYTEFLPISRADMEARGWDQLDFVVVGGDAYVDHPSFGTAIISRLLEAEGYKVGVLAQPRYSDCEDFKRFGRPKYGFFIGGGNVDSMVSHYSVAKIPRAEDEYSPGGIGGARPDRSATVSGNSPIIAALAQAAENGKQVTVLVELKARFDEENNIVWARMLEKAGCHVIYGLVGLKTHSKITLVVRREEDGIRRYVHLGTGNYNDATAKLYTDVGMLTCAERIGEDATAVFNMLSGYSEPLFWNKLALAPLWLKDKFLHLIEREKNYALEGKNAHIIAKMNSLCDKDIIRALYEASAAGVKIELIVRGICCLKVGIPGVSENISVRSIVGNFLEHSRIFYFANDDH